MQLSFAILENVVVRLLERTSKCNEGVARVFGCSDTFETIAGSQL